jgi:hypothetical protein
VFEECVALAEQRGTRARTLVGGGSSVNGSLEGAGAVFSDEKCDE